MVFIASRVDDFGRIIIICIVFGVIDYAVIVVGSTIYSIISAFVIICRVVVSVAIFGRIM